MSVERLAREIARSLARNQSRGLVDDAGGLADVVVHGRVDLVRVADDILAASLAEWKPVNRSWGGWFVGRAEARRSADRRARSLQALAERLEGASDEAEAALIRLRRRRMLEPGEF